MLAQSNGFSAGDSVPKGMLATVPVQDKDNPKNQFAPYNPGAIELAQWVWTEFGSFLDTPQFY